LGELVAEGQGELAAETLVFLGEFAVALVGELRTLPVLRGSEGSGR
jgi:hypothetical protein